MLEGWGCCEKGLVMAEGLVEQAVLVMVRDWCCCQVVLGCWVLEVQGCLREALGWCLVGMGLRHCWVLGCQVVLGCCLAVLGCLQAVGHHHP
jgi:hypothetical protein